VRAAVTEAGMPTRSVVSFDDHVENERWLLEMHRELNHPRGADGRVLLDLFRIWMRAARRNSAVARAAHVPASLIAARAYIQEHWRRRFTLGAVAEACHVSPSHLCKGFRKHFGVSPVSLAIDLKLDHAQELLRDADLTVTEVALECGFADIFYFSRTFKKRIGIGPKAYRRKILSPDH
jgi:AraC-like DNA-binding protein